MIVLKDAEELVRKDEVELYGDDGRKYGKGMLYLTNTRVMFETENGTVPRLVALHTIQSVVPIKNHEFTVSYMNDDGIKILTDRYKMRDENNCNDWIKDFQKISNTSESLGTDSTSSRSTTEGRGNGLDSSLDGRQDVNDAVVNASSKTLSWQKVEGWRKFPEEHIWQGTKRLDSMKKEEWLALKKESMVLDEKLDRLHSEYYEAKKSKNKQRCREIKEEMKLIDKELYGGGVVPFKSIATDTWPER
jgi:hypothetical protein